MISAVLAMAKLASAKPSPRRLALLALLAGGCHWFVPYAPADEQRSPDGGLRPRDAALDGGRADAALDSEAADAAPDGRLADTTRDTVAADAELPDASVEGPPPTPNIVFVTSTTVTPGKLGGVSAADAHCAERATAGGLSGTYLAWLSSASTPAIARLAGRSGWVRPDGKPVAASDADLAAGHVLYPIRVDELGNERAYDDVRHQVATGTLGTGNAAADTCNDWTDDQVYYVRGTIHGSGHLFTSYFSTHLCSLTSRLYCFGVGHSAPVPMPVQGGRVAFLSQQKWRPGKGRADADAICQAEASAAGLSGTFLALLPDALAPAASRFDLTSPTWVRPDFDEVGQLSS